MVYSFELFGEEKDERNAPCFGVTFSFEIRKLKNMLSAKFSVMKWIFDMQEPEALNVTTSYTIWLYKLTDYDGKTYDICTLLLYIKWLEVIYKYSSAKEEWLYSLGVVNYYVARCSLFTFSPFFFFSRVIIQRQNKYLLFNWIWIHSFTIHRMCEPWSSCCLFGLFDCRLLHFNWKTHIHF